MKFRPFKEVFEIPLRNGLTKPKRVRGEGFKMINMGELFGFSRMKNIPMDRVPLTEREKESSMVEPGDLLFARQSLVREGAGQCAIFLEDEEEVCFESHLIRCRLNKEIANPLFYYYYFSSRVGKMAIDAIIEQGAGAAGIRSSDLAKVLVPDLEKDDQDRISENLDQMDDKIELNRQINQTLEEMAQAIFKSWFVDFEPVKAKTRAKANGQDPERAAICAISEKTDAELDHLLADQLAQLRATAALFPDELTDSELGLIPKGWKVTKLDKVINTTDYVANGSFASLKANVDLFDEENDVLYVRTTDFNNDFSGNLKFTTLHAYEFLSKSKLFGRETIVSNVGDVGTVFRPPVWLGKPMTLASNAVALITEKYNSYVFCYFRSYLGQHQVQSIVTGSAQLKFNKTNLRNLRIIWPSGAILEVFENFEMSLDKKAVALQQESNSLKDTRDTLLPKLLSGEIELSQEA